jgi:hypothetical protein
MKLALGLGLPSGGVIFSPLSLSPFWWVTAASAFLFQEEDGTGAISAAATAAGYMADRSGNGRHVTQATASKRPLYQTDGSLEWIETDGTDDFLGVDLSTLAQPYTVMVACRPLSATQAGANNVLGTDGSSNGDLFWDEASGTWRIYGGSVLAGDTRVTDQDVVLTAEYNGASSSIQVDEAIAVTGDAGSSGRGGLYIGAGSGGITQFAHMRFYSGIVVPGLLSMGVKQQLRNFFTVG